MASGEFSGKPDEMLGGNLEMDWHPIQEGVAPRAGWANRLQNGLKFSVQYMQVKLVPRILIVVGR